MRKTQLFLRPFRDGGKWLGIAHIRYIARYTSGTLRSMTKKKRPDVVFETFDQAAEHYQLTEEDLLSRERKCFYLAMIYLFVMLCMFTYGVSLFLYHHIVASISAFSVSMMVLSFSFREHFWYIQLKHRCLGLTFSKWIQLTFRK